MATNKSAVIKKPAATLKDRSRAGTLDGGRERNCTQLRDCT
jgi:hypothetical protein